MDAPAPQQQQPPPGFLDVPYLLEQSQPRQRVAWFWYAVGVFLLIVMGSTLLGNYSPQMRTVVQALSALTMIGLVAGLALLTMTVAKRHQGEREALEAAGELVRMRRWPEAGALLHQFLSQPARSPALRAQALIYLAAVLARYHRFGDAIHVHEYLLDHELVDDQTAYGLRLGRAMAMLREDHLFDADRAINELRRLAPDAGAAARANDSAGLALIEIYRDVKTGHPDEAVAIFEDKLTVLRDALGHRVADAYALAARAYDLLGRPAEAQQAYARATLLAPLIELQRRYPEILPLAERYQPAPAPPEAA